MIQYTFSTLHVVERDYSQLPLRQKLLGPAISVHLRGVKGSKERQGPTLTTLSFLYQQDVCLIEMSVHKRVVVNVYLIHVNYNSLVNRTGPEERERGWFSCLNICI